MIDQTALQATPILDPITLNDNIGGLDQDTQNLVKLSFLTDLKNCISLISEAAPQQNVDVLQSQTHILKSITGTFGAIRLNEISTRLNRTCQTIPENLDWADIDLLLTIGDETIKTFEE